MRISKVQGHVLVLLLAFENRGRAGPILGADMLRIINGQRGNPVAIQNFRVSCHKLHENGLVEQYRDRTLKLFYRLTDQGRELAQERMEADE